MHLAQFAKSSFRLELMMNEFDISSSDLAIASFMKIRDRLKNPFNKPQDWTVLSPGSSPH
jgi:hypothetical protein